MRNIFLFFAIIVANIISAQEIPDSVLMTINGKAVLVDEFYEIKNKNTSLNSEMQLSEQEYFDLFVNYKLKLIEAKAQNIHKSEEFLNEFDKYTKQIANPYIFTEEIKENVLKEIYDRYQFDLKVGHVFVKLEKGASPEDTVNAYKKALKIRSRLLKGEDFSTVAKATSDDPGVNENGGIIGYITAMVTPLYYEEAAYALKPGQISQPVRATQGYYIIKVFDKRKSYGEVKVNQVMLLSRDGDDDDVLKETIDSVYQKAINGADFNELSRQYSTEPKTKESGGDLYWFDNASRLPFIFKETSLSLPVGKISKPFKTKFGWHLVKVIDKHPIKPYEEKKKEIQAFVLNSNTRKHLASEQTIANLKKKLSFKSYYDSLTVFMNKVDSSILTGTWKHSDNFTYDKVLLSIGGVAYKEADFAQWLENNASETKRKYDKDTYISYLFDAYKKQELLKMARRRLFEENEQFYNEVKDYYDGMLIFEISDREVWTKANSDTAGVKKYYEAHKDDYRWNERVKVNIYICKDSVIAKDLNKFLKKKASKKWSTEKVLAIMNKKDSSLVTVKTKIYATGDNKIIDSYDWASGSVFWENSVTAVELVEKVPPTTKLFTECKGLVVADYQKQLEKEWLASLRSKYDIVINQKLLNEISTH